MIVAIDGPAGSGKSTVAKKVAEQLGYSYLDTGAMYRAVTYLALKEKINLNDRDSLTRLVETAEITFKDEHIKNEHMGIYSDVIINGQLVTEEIRQPEVDANVSIVSEAPGVRREMVRKQRQLAGDCAIVEGRDIGTVVFPQAKVKVFLTATKSERARRRTQELKTKGEKIKTGKVRSQIEKRDRLDSKRLNSPLKKADDAVEIDTTDKSINQVVSQIMSLIKNDL